MRRITCCFPIKIHRRQPPSPPSTITLSSYEYSSLAVGIISDLKEEGCDTLLVKLQKDANRKIGMGVGVRDRGILITTVVPGSVAAEKLKVGDRILAVNGRPILDQRSVVKSVKASGQRLYLQIARPHKVHK
ncbi:PDZ domain-containing protein C52A11.3 [Caenorhabditis elegans]|uniref:PDZ domain-containing protein C52A11.3 n=1 Tax=Caenorhabditis elegans TaxID=6239 RepID=YQJ3_CAEEL|nr:PDZ domain-containing protein C52A11.3 [Caenorhabditis elegans]Q09284.2 RecName: Full=PDZ domain-containing protein C52A11.3 [Caenorhabditis elegans]CAA86765.2 PDZ domain-containing protein C52A11.3 [Caenorhabditis elegans]|eukprot:NP_496315.2 PDZ domain-containing protein C52A11.3 [Caenorhabditis elegans]